MKPILHVVEGEVVLREKVRTSARALARLADLAVEAAGDSDVDIAVQHLDARRPGPALVRPLLSRLGCTGPDRSYLSEVGAVVAAHTGPGVIGVDPPASD